MNDLIVFVNQNSVWLAAAAVFCAVFSGLAAMAAYREAKTGFFALVRETAARRAQRTALLATTLLVLGGALGAMPRLIDTPTSMASAPAPTPTPTRTRYAPGLFQATATPVSVVEPTLPASQVTPTVAATVEAAAVPTSTVIAGAPIAAIVFSKGVSANLQPIEPGEVFPPGSAPVYALFKFTGMSNGQAWSQVWTHDGQEFKRKQGTWRWGPRGSAYVSGLPPGGFKPGMYQVQLFVGDALVSSAQFKVQ